MNVKEILLEKIEKRTAAAGVVGLGYTGLPLAVEAAKAGFATTGFDIQAKKVDMVNNARNYIADVSAGDLEAVVNNGKLKATGDFSLIRNIDCVMICVPTPLDKHRMPDISRILDAAGEIAKYLHPGMLIVLESTTYPGTTEEVLKPVLENTGLKCGEDFYLAFSPERVDPGNKLYNTRNTPKVVGGAGRTSTEIAAAFYRNILEADVKEVSCTAVAEMEKILENTFRNINIGLVNEMAILCGKMGINVWEVIDAARTKPYGFMTFYPGPGVGGHCIPVDPFYLTWKASEYGYHTRLIETAGEINQYMPEYVLERSMKILNRSGKSLKGAKIFILGIAYKQDMDDIRESPALQVMDHLAAHGAELVYNDPYIREFIYNDKKYESVELTGQVLTESDLVIITTMHSSYDYDFIQHFSSFVFDTRNAMKNVKARGNIEVL